MAIRNPQRPITDDGWFSESAPGGAHPQTDTAAHAPLDNNELPARAPRCNEPTSGNRLDNFVEYFTHIALLAMTLLLGIGALVEKKPSQTVTIPASKSVQEYSAEISRTVPIRHNPDTIEECLAHQYRPADRDDGFCENKTTPTRTTVTIGPWPPRSVGEVLRKYNRHQYGDNRRSR